MPAIHLLWKRYQAELLDQLEENGEDLILGGDGRHMEHILLFCCNISKIIDFALVQVSMSACSTSHSK